MYGPDVWGTPLPSVGARVGASRGSRTERIRPWRNHPTVRDIGQRSRGSARTRRANVSNAWKTRLPAAHPPRFRKRIPVAVRQGCPGTEPAEQTKVLNALPTGLRERVEWPLSRGGHGGDGDRLEVRLPRTRTRRTSRPCGFMATRHLACPATNGGSFVFHSLIRIRAH